MFKSFFRGMTALSRFTRLAGAVVMTCAMPLASATVLTFDDLGSGTAFFLSNYQGFTFGTNNLATTAWFHSAEVSPYYAPHSGSVFIATDFTLYNDSSYEATQSISNAAPFVFNGAYFSSDGDSIGYQLLLGSTVVFTSAPSAPLSEVSTFVPSGYAGLVTSVVVFGHQGYYALDDFTFTAAAATGVPEPESIALLGIGLVAAVFAARRKSRAA